MNTNVKQVYAPTQDEEEEGIEDSYKQVVNALRLTTKSERF